MNNKLDNIRHSLAHLLAAAVLEIHPDTKLAIGPTIENGFYYDFLFPEGADINDELLPELEKKMQKLIKDELPFSGKEVSFDEIKKEFKNQPFKLELAEEFSKNGEKLTVYSTGEIFDDLCLGGHVKNTKDIDPNAFKLTHVAGAYWRGDENNQMLTRIYGVAFENKKELDKYLEQLEKAKRRDHRKLGKELDLYTTSELVGAGLPLWTPKGTFVRHALDNYVWELRKKNGYEKVEIPHITKRELYEVSGHWEKFQDDLFKIDSREGHQFAIKPMNCPHHTQIFARRQWSYREMPQRYANTTMCYRDEQTGELHGLSRLRAFSQDDSHVFCRQSQIKEEMGKAWDMIDEFYSSFGFALEVRLSLHDPENMEDYLGDKKTWTTSENMLREIANERKVKIQEQIGEAAFYGPKIDFIAKDSLGREWQVGTNQLDMSLPERFDLTCINEEGEKERIYMIHVAIMGSLERFMSILLEHTGGVLPTWLSPVQVSVIPIGEDHQKYAYNILDKLQEAGVRAMLLGSGDTLGKRIRESETQKIPYILIIGDKEKKKKTVSVRGRDGDLGSKKLEKFLKEIK